MSVTTLPQGAFVITSDGQSCTAPCTIEAARDQLLQLTFVKAGCLTQSQTIQPRLQMAERDPGATVAYGPRAIYNLEPNPLVAELNCRGGRADILASN